MKDESWLGDNAKLRDVLSSAERDLCDTETEDRMAKRLGAALGISIAGVGATAIVGGATAASGAGASAGAASAGAASAGAASAGAATSIAPAAAVASSAAAGSAAKVVSLWAVAKVALVLTVSGGGAIALQQLASDGPEQARDSTSASLRASSEQATPVAEATPVHEREAIAEALVSPETPSEIPTVPVPTIENPASESLVRSEAQPSLAVEASDTPVREARIRRISAQQELPTMTVASEALLHEVNLLERLRRASPVETLRLVAEHRALGGDTVLAEERDFYEVSALVRLGRSEEANRARDRFESRYPGSLFRSRIESLLPARAEK